MSSKHTFTYTSDHEGDLSDGFAVMVETKAELLEKVIAAMEAYLLACGYVFPENCHLGFEEDETVDTTTRFDIADISTHPDNGA